ncbi:ethanolamine-phosphate cytidylyltransferase isoform X2 [Cucumis melo var. makuwa]|uniref:ethanolamine-phosphate cytidylyltransferase n=1 Tax=Cucumis melo var. makuwa TaxID=1194695 RepID=A0A5A7TRN1_CUCMM|nr:ethanolamine-phosphate cytidylyltransferase isoform X2 [Cucumis melo var. makuwa]
MKGARTGTGSVDLDADPSENTQRWARFVATCLIGGLVIGISVLGLHFGAPHQPSLRIWRRKKKPVRVYMDGCFDMMHYGHCNALRQARALGDQLVVGVVSDSEITANKGPPVTPLNERMIMVNAVKWVDEVIPNAPYAITEDFMRKLFDEYKIDYIIHGDDPCVLPDGTDAYALAKKAGRYKQIKRTEGVSSTDIVGRMLLCVRERSISDNQNHSSLQRQFSHGHSQKFDDGGSGTGTRVSHFLPTSRRIVQFSNGKEWAKGKFSPFSLLSHSFVFFRFGSLRITTSVSLATTFSSPTIPASDHPPKTFGEHIYLPGIEMEVDNCKVVESYYCIWFGKGFLKVEDVGFNRIMLASKSQLC